MNFPKESLVNESCTIETAKNPSILNAGNTEYRLFRINCTRLVARRLCKGYPYRRKVVRSSFEVLSTKTN